MTDGIYPNVPGFKEGDTSKEAASKIEGRAATLRAQTLACIGANPGLMADQIAEALGESIMAIRPRVSELRKLNMITNDGRGVNASGSSAHRWRVTTDAERKQLEEA